MSIYKSGSRLLTYGLVAVAASQAIAGPNVKNLSTTQPSKSPDLQRRLAAHEAKFYENRGQWDQRGQYVARQPHMDLWFESRGVDFDYYSVSGTIKHPQRKGQRVSMEFVGHQGPIRFKGSKLTGSVNDYLMGGSAVHRSRGFGEVVSKSVFNGVDFRGYYENSRPRYDFIVAPNANVASIKLRFEGADKVALSSKGIVLGTHLGDRIQGDLHVYQLLNGVRKVVDARFALLAKNEIGIKVGAYDHSRSLVVDPLIYGTYFGGDSGWDTVRSVVSDNSTNGSSYMTGDTQSLTFPAIYGPYGLNLKGQQSAFLAKLQGDAYNIDYAAYIGGTQVDSGQFLKIDPSGNVWMAGNTTSSDFPGNTRPNKILLQGANGTTSGTFQLQFNNVDTTGALNFNATTTDVLNALNTIPALKGKVTSVTEVDGTTLANGGRYEIDLPAMLAGNVFVDNSSVPYSSVVNPFIFLLPFHASSSTVLTPLPTQEFSYGNAFGTELNGYDIKQVSNPVVGSPVDMVVSGTVSRQVTEFASVPYPGHDDTPKGYMFRIGFTSSGGYKLNAPFSTYISGGFAVNNRGVALDGSGNAYTVGTVFGDANYDTSVNPVFVTTSNVFFGGRELRQADVYVQKYSGSSGSLIWSGLLGGHSTDLAGGFTEDVDLSDVPTGSAVAVDPTGNVYVTAITNSFDYPRTRGVYGEDFTDLQNVAVTKVSTDGTTILYSTNLNSSNNNIPAGIAVDERGDAFVTGNGIPGEIFPEDLGQMAGDPDQPTTTTYPNIGVTSDGLAQPTFPTAPQIGVFSAWVNVVNADATSLLYGSWLGGSLDTRVYGPYVDSFGDCWLYGWVESFRGYAIFSSTGTPTIYQANASLPASMLSANAFKSYPDNGGPSQVTGAYSPLDEFGNPFLAAPPSVEFSELRDGWVNKIRVGLPSVQSLTMTPSTIPGGFGASSIGTITLSTAAPSGGATVSVSILSGSGGTFDSVLTDPPLLTTTVTIPQGSTTGTFTVFSEIVTANQVLTIQANYLGTFEDAALNIIPYLNKFTVTPATIVGGSITNPPVGTIQLVQVAPTGGIPVTLSTATPSLISFSGQSSTTVTVPAGAATLTVPITTSGVSKSTPASVTAAIGGFRLTQTITLLPASLQTLTFSPNPAADGTVVQGTVALNGLAGSTMRVALTQIGGNPLKAGSFPSSIPITYQTSSATFSVSLPVLTANGSVSIQATVIPGSGEQYSTSPISGTLVIDHFSLSALSITPTTLTPGQTAVGTVSISSAALTGGVNVTVTSSSPTDLAITGSPVNIPAGSSSGTFVLTAGFPDTTKTVTVSATFNNQTISQTVTIQPVTFTLVLDPPELPGGQATTASIISSVPAPAGGLTVNLSVTPANAGVAIQSSVFIPAGTSEVDNIPISTTAVSQTETVTIVATYSEPGSKTSESTTAQLILDPVGVATISFNPNPVHGGQSTQCTVTLTGAALKVNPTDTHVVVTLSSSNPSILLPSSISIPIGSTSATIPINIARVSRNISTTVTATFNGQATTVLTVLR